MSKINDIHFEFKEYIKENGFPFLDKLNFNNKYNFYDFIKYSSKNYNKLMIKIEKEKEDFFRELMEDDDDNNIETNYENYTD